MTLWEERCMLYEQCIEFLSDGTNNSSKEAEENPPPLSDEELNPASPDSIPVFDGMSQEQRKEFALELIALARIELSEQFYDGAKYSLEVAEHCFPMEESKKMLKQLAILEQTSRTETN
jgi:hypothetical protein